MSTLLFEKYERTERSYVYNVYSSILKLRLDRMQYSEECLLFYLKDMKGQYTVKGETSTILLEGYERTECN